MIRLTPEAVASVRAFVKENGVKAPIRIDIHSTGCCDPSLGLCVDRRRDDDLVHETEGFTIVIDPQTSHTVGEVRIAFFEDPGKTGFVLTSNKPLSEWQGFGVCDIRLK